jgi:hypothetical protein
LPALLLRARLLVPASLLFILLRLPAFRRLVHALALRRRLPAVWLHAPARSVWAALHVVRRHGGGVENVVILEIDVPRSWLKRNRKGVWYTRRDVPQARFRRFIDFIEVAGPPAAGVAGEQFHAGC